ncbi:hypothetical protein ACQ4PT_003339 [Festuca glaucescens]
MAGAGGWVHPYGSRRAVVVVVGGGVAGALVANSLQDLADVILIDPKEYLEIPWTNMISKVEPSVAEKSLINHNDYLGGTRVITASSADVRGEAVITAEGRLVEYTYLVIATDNMKIKYSRSILIIGGESSGVELATEIAVNYPDKKVTLVHDRPRLLESIGHKAGGKALRWLRSKNVEVHLEQSVDLESMSEGDRLFRTSSGIEITADCYFSCLDGPLSSSWIRDSELKDCLDSDGRLMVDANLRVKGQSNIFAAGDITDAPELNQGYFVQRHAMVVSKNIKLLMEGAKDSKLLKYKPSSTVPMVSLGKTDAVVQLSFAMVVGYLPAMWKSRDLYVNRTRTLLGLAR